MRATPSVSLKMERIITALGYQLVNQIQEGEFAYSFRVSKNKVAAVLKILRDEWSAPQVIQRFYHDFMIGAQLKHPFIATYQQLKVHEKNLIILQQDNGGVLLAEWLPQNGVGLETFFNLALPLVTIVNYLHQQGIVHKGLTPHTFLFNVEVNRIQCIDFSDALQLNQPVDEGHDIDLVIRNLPYTAPECLQPNNQPIDYRADLYSLGVIFYQLLTGRLPFVAQNPIELMQEQLAAPTPQVANHVAIPEVINTLITKLLSNKADNRYADGRALHMDLHRCYVAWEKSGYIKHVELGQLHSAFTS